MSKVISIKSDGEININKGVNSPEVKINEVSLGNTGSSSETSGASAIGVFNDFDNSDSETVQEILKDYDTRINEILNSINDLVTRVDSNESNISAIATRANNIEADINSLTLTVNAIDPLVNSDADSDWHIVGSTGEPAFENDWQNFTGAGRPVMFRKDAFGFIYVTGLIRRTSSSTFPVVFTLPEGCRPIESQLDFIVAETSYFGQKGYGNASVLSNGRVYIYSDNNNEECSLDGIQFYAGF